MPFNSTDHANLGYVDKKYKDMLDNLCAAHKRSIKAELEYLIEQAANHTELLPPNIRISRK
jgi:hypothetical protein